MLAKIRLVLDMAGRALAFLLGHPDPNPATAQVIGKLASLVSRSDSLAQLQRTSQITGTAAVNLKNDLRVAIEDGMIVLSGISLAIVKSHPDMTIHIRLPQGRVAESTFVTIARVAVAEASARKELFVVEGMPEALLDEMTKLLDDYEAALTRQRNALSTQVGASAQLAAVATDIIGVVKHLDKLNRRRFKKDPELKAAWKSARNVAWREAHDATVPTGEPPTTPDSTHAA